VFHADGQIHRRTKIDRQTDMTKLILLVAILPTRLKRIQQSNKKLIFAKKSCVSYVTRKFITVSTNDSQ
jgi:hypothetical protein